jgi:hypothetical protein
MIKGYIIYVDMDGVIADFQGAMVDRFGWDFNSAPSRRQAWKAIQRYDQDGKSNGEKGWFYSLPKMKDADKLWAFVTANFANVEILTASGSTPRDAQGQKRAWIGDNFGYDIRVNIVESGAEKASYATEKTVLIDDRQKVINPFINAGGIGVLHTSASKTIATLKTMMGDWE